MVRFSNKNVICQIANAAVAGDVIVAQATSQELKRYGLTVGLTNYAATYATGLLLARIVLTKFDLADTYKGAEEITGGETALCHCLESSWWPRQETAAWSIPTLTHLKSVCTYFATQQV